MVVVVVWAALACAVVEWFAVWREQEQLQALAKTLVPAVLITAIVVDAPGTSSGFLVATGLGFALVGDVLLLPQLDRFEAGLGAFLLAHVLFIPAFLVAEPDAVSSSVLVTASSGPNEFGVAIMILSGVVAAALGWRIVGAVRDDPDQPGALAFAVGTYIVVLTVMLLAGLSTGAWLASIGAAAFAASDAVLGWNRFLRPVEHGRLKTHMLYHPALILITLWVVN